MHSAIKKTIEGVDLWIHIIDDRGIKVYTKDPKKSIGSKPSHHKILARFTERTSAFQSRLEDEVKQYVLDIKRKRQKEKDKWTSKDKLREIINGW